jgi:hypothetical protein
MTMQQTGQAVPKIDTMEQARARIAELERKLDEAIDIVVRRTDQLEAAERRVRALEARLPD